MAGFHIIICFTTPRRRFLYILDASIHLIYTGTCNGAITYFYNLLHLFRTLADCSHSISYAYAPLHQLAEDILPLIIFATPASYYRFCRISTISESHFVDT